MKPSSWTLTDAEKLAAENKYTFSRSSPDAIAALKIGDAAKLGFKLNIPDAESGVETERMWVQIEMVDGSGGFLGRLLNAPRHIRDLAKGDAVRFSERHIMSTELDEQHPGEDSTSKYLVRCFASRKIFQDGEKVAVFFREAPEVRGDSGWRFFTGMETESYMAEPESMQYVSLGAVLRCGDAFVDLLESPVGSYFELNPATGEFEEFRPQLDEANNEESGGPDRPTIH